MAGSMCDCGGPCIEAMSTPDLEDLLKIMYVAEPGLCAAIRVELGMRKMRIVYEGYGGA